MSNENWKEFEDNLVSHSAAHYLMTINELLDANGYARVTDIAKRLNITRGSCSISLKPLKRLKLVVEDENRFLRLSTEGKRLAEMITLNDQLLEVLFRDVLQISEEQAEVDACKLEHLLSIETSTKLAAFIRLWTEDPSIAKLVTERLNQQESGCSGDSKVCEYCSSICFQNVSPKNSGTIAPP